MSADARHWMRIHAKLALARFAKQLDAGPVGFQWLMTNRHFRRIVVRALQAEVFDGRADWPAMRLMEDAVDEWILEEDDRIERATQAALRDEKR